MSDGETLPREEWFFPPDGILDGTDFDIARGFIERERADMAYWRENPGNEDPEATTRRVVANASMEELLVEYEARLEQGDERLARLLRYRVEREMEELNSGMRTTTTGEAHLLAERTRQVGHIFGVKIEGNPAPPYLNK